MNSYHSAILLLLLSIGCIAVYMLLPKVSPTVIITSEIEPLHLENDGLKVSIDTYNHRIIGTLHIHVTQVPAGTKYISVTLAPANLQITTGDIAKTSNALLYTFVIDNVPGSFELPVEGVKDGMYNIYISASASNFQVNRIAVHTQLEIVNSI